MSRRTGNWSRWRGPTWIDGRVSENPRVGAAFPPLANVLNPTGFTADQGRSNFPLAFLTDQYYIHDRSFKNWS